MRTIQELRDAAGWTQAELAAKVGVSAQTVSNWETGRYEPKASQLRALARAFGVSMDEIDFAAPMENVGRPESPGCGRRRNRRGGRRRARGRAVT